MDGATPFDTEERICGACWLDEVRMRVEYESELRRLKRNEYNRQWKHKKRMAIKRAPSASAVLPPRFISGDEDKVDVMGCASPVSVTGKRGRSISEWQVEDTEDP